jgi:acetolactate synthase-1/2/3 large subunit
MSTSAAQRLVESLVAHGVDRVFCVPGESYLDILDALRDSSIHTIVARQEGGAAMMAEADGKLTGRPGVCFVTRGPGATNASSGIHVAEQDSTPLVLFVGNVASNLLGRGAFQEIDYEKFYGGIAKKVFQLTAGDDVAEIVRSAFGLACNGRPGPVVVALPEDLLGQSPDRLPPVRTISREIEVPSAADVATFANMLERAERPIAIVGGSGWSRAGVGRLHAFAEGWGVPVSVVFRRQQLFDHDHPNYAGDCGIGLNPKLKNRIETADLVMLLGTRFSEIPSQGYTLLEQPTDRMRLIHVHCAECGRFPHADLALRCHPEHVLKALGNEAANRIDRRTAHVVNTRADFEAWTAQPPRIPGSLQMGEVIQHLRAVLPDGAVICNGAGNYATWVHRYFRFRRFGTQLAPTSGSMGYGLPAAIAAKLRHPDQPVVCFAGDGCFQMTSQEFGTAVQHRANVIVLVVDNGMHGTIRMHQERRFPERAHATDLVNPDFAAIARAYGGFGATVARTAEFAPALQRALAADAPAILHLLLDPEAITPDTTLSALARG